MASFDLPIRRHNACTEAQGGALVRQAFFWAPFPLMTIFDSIPALPHPVSTPSNPSMWLHFTPICIRRQVRHAPYGPWDHVPPNVWTDKINSAAMQDEGEDKVEASQFVVSAGSIIVPNGLTPKLVGIKLFGRHMRNDMH